jgi:L-malate glycosyltransferase
MLCGLPAVVSDVGDLPELVEEGSNGFLVAERTPQAFADRMLALAGDPERLRSFSEAARQAALAYSLERTTGRWDRILALEPTTQDGMIPTPSSRVDK